jgi:dolichol-phosphate mannosyltransferase
MSTLVIIPTYNEAANITALVKSIFALGLDIRVLIVDDNSPDGTGNLADKLATDNPRILVLHRPKKEGLGRAYLDGFRYAVDKTGCDFIMEMDADFSHDPQAIPVFLDKIKTCDVVVGSRFYKGRVSIVNWPLTRLIMSYGASVYVRLFSRLRLYDPTSGFKCFRRRCIESILRNRVISDGYAFQIEVNYMCAKMGFVIEEVPIVFYDRSKGSSKMRTFRTVLDAMSVVWLLKFKRFKQILYKTP